MPALNREQFAPLIPHAGAMCLWDEVLDYDANTIHCRTLSHRTPQHPLRRDGCLSALHLIEYGAQTMAIHGELLARDAGVTERHAGLLAAIRDASIQLETLDALTGVLECRARRLVLNGSGSMYEFTLHSGGLEVARACASVIYT